MDLISCPLIEVPRFPLTEGKMDIQTIWILIHQIQQAPQTIQRSQDTRREDHPYRDPNIKVTTQHK
eukprot:10712171-Ditylum_brightwellii.AAC.1